MAKEKVIKEKAPKKEPKVKAAKAKIPKEKKVKPEKESGFDTSFWMVEKRGEYVMGIFTRTNDLNKFLSNARKEDPDLQLNSKLIPEREFPFDLIQYVEDGEVKFQTASSKKDAKETTEFYKLKKPVFYKVEEAFQSIKENPMKSLKIQKV